MAAAGPAIRAMREAAGISLTELAELAGCDSGYLSRVERRRRTPSRYFLDHLSKVLADAIAGKS